MEVNGSVKINSLFAGRDEVGGITLYGAYYEQSKKLLIVVRSTRHMKTIIMQELFGEEYTEEHVVNILKERPTHNLIVNSSRPVTMPIDMDKVIIID